jgi:hypothetical protein
VGVTGVIARGKGAVRMTKTLTIMISNTPAITQGKDFLIGISPENCGRYTAFITYILANSPDNVNGAQEARLFASLV